MDLRAIRRIDWEHVVNRNEPALFRSFTAAAGDRIRRIAGLRWQPTVELRPGPELLHSRRELNNLRQILERMGIQSYRRFRGRLLRTMRRFKRLTDTIERTNVRGASIKRLRALFVAYVEAAPDAHAFLMPLPVADRVLASFILDRLPHTSDSQRQQWLATLSFPEKENLHVLEERSFLNLVGLYVGRSDRFNAALKRHQKRFSRLGARGMWWKYAWTTGDFRKRIREFITQGKDWRVELRHLNDVRRAQTTATGRLVRELGLQRSLPLIKLVKEFAYLRTYRTDVIYNAHYAVQNLLREIAKRCGIRPADDIVFLTFREVLASIEKTTSVITLAELARRKIFFATFVHDGVMELVSGKTWERRIRRLITNRHRPVAEVRGASAYAGRAQGRVAVVSSAADLQKVRRGNILVAVMTFPHYVPAMEKAAAFVTDEGGVLCHAAIVAREMRKPCVIGTKHATQVLKDGDLVEVDAERGIVRKLPLPVRSPAPLPPPPTPPRAGGELGAWRTKGPKKA